MSTRQQQLDYIERQLVYDLFKYFGKDASLVSHRIECSNGLDDCLSSFYTVELELKVAGNDQKELVLVKLMKGSPEFRESNKSYTQFANEVFLYAELLPAYEQLLRGSKLEIFVVDEFVPRAYCAKFGQIDGLGDDRESVLAVQHLKPAGYGLGPELTLRHDQLEAMCNILAQFHAHGHAIRILQPQVHARLRAKLVELPLNFEANQASLYRSAFDRLYQYYDRQREQLTQDTRFADAMERLRLKYFENPLLLLENIRVTSLDSHFVTFLHGDFNRNNVLFHENEEGRVDNVKMLNFQEMRYSTIAIDLSYFLYMQTILVKREVIFPKLLKQYHTRLHEMLELLLQRNHDQFSEEQLQQLLEDYSYDCFEEHFKRYAFFGVIKCMYHVLREINDNKITTLEVNEYDQQIFKVMEHAFEQGYMDWI